MCFYRLMRHITFGDIRNSFKKKHTKTKTKENIRKNEYLLGETKKEIAESQNHWHSNLMTHLQLYQKAANLHPKTFSEYKNKHNGCDIALIACGPTVNDFVAVPDTIYVGVNRAFKKSDIKLDYIFVEDYEKGMFSALEDYYKENKDIKKFYGIHQGFAINDQIISESVSIRHNASRFYTRIRWKHPTHEVLVRDEEFAFDIATEPLTCSGSVVFPAMQFILYTNPKRIFIYGCDCSADAHFYDTKNTTKDTSWAGDPSWTAAIHGWKLLKKFADKYYPETEIISVNPVGLRGLFRDVYTESFLAKHPEIDRMHVKIFNGEL